MFSCYKFFLNYFRYILQLLGLFLPIEFIDLTVIENENKFWIFKQIYAVFISVLFVIGYTFSEWLSSQTTYKSIRTSKIILDVLCHTTLTAICLLGILGTAFWWKEKWSHYLKLQRILKSKMKMKLKRNSLQYCMEFIAENVALLIVCGVELWRQYLFDKCDVVQLLSTSLKFGLFYYIYLITTIIYNVIVHLKENFKSVKIYLTNIVCSEECRGHFALYQIIKGDRILPKMQAGDRMLFGLIEASRILNIIFQCLDNLNSIFGIILLLFNMSTVLTILSSLNILLIAAETNTLSIELALSCMAYALLFLVWHSFILTASGLLKQESSEIVILCCKLQQLLPQNSQERKELLNIAHQIRRTSPKISAAGFFDVDFYLFLAVFTCVGTYIVVLIQFTHMDF